MPKRGFEALVDHEKKLKAEVREIGTTPLDDVKTEESIEPVEIEGVNFEEAVTLTDLIDNASEALSNMYSQEQIEELIEELDPDIPILITETIEKRVTPEDSVIAVSYYKNWVIKQNNSFNILETHCVRNAQIFQYKNRALLQNISHAL